MELDILLPEKNKAIEFNGTYYHADPRFYQPNDLVRFIKKEKIAKDVWQYDEKKAQKCKEKGIQLLIVWEDDWNKDNENERIKIQNFINHP